MLLDHESGVTSIVDCSYATRLAVEPFPETLIEVDGSQGSLRLNQAFELVGDGQPGRIAAKTSRHRCCPGRHAPGTISRKASCGSSNIGSIALRQGREPATSGRDNVKTLALVEAAYRRTRRAGETVEVAQAMSVAGATDGAASKPLRARLVDIERGGAVEMFDHRSLGGVGIAGGHASDDLLVLGEGQIFLAGPDQHFGVVFASASPAWPR